MFIITRHGLHGKPTSYIYGSYYLLQWCGFIKLRFKIGQANFTLNDGRYYVSQKFGHILKNFGCFDFMYADIIFRLTVQPRWHFKIFIAESTLESSSPKGRASGSDYARRISTSKVSASLLQGNTVPTIRSLFFAREKQF